MSTDTARFNDLLRDVKAAGEDYELYPTSEIMLAVVARHLPSDAKSLLDIGAGDGRALLRLAEKCEHAELYAIEKAAVLRASWSEQIVPVGTEFFEQDLVALAVEYLFCNCPYSEYETWTVTIIASGHAKRAFLVLPRRWQENEAIAAALKARGARARIIYSGDFLDAPRRARAIIDIVEISYPMKDAIYGRQGLEDYEDPFDTWFDAHIAGSAAFENAEESERAAAQTDYERAQAGLAKIRHLSTIEDLVAGYNEEYSRMERNYRAIFELDAELLRELSVSKDNVRTGIKLKMVGLKSKYWTVLFERLRVITDRLSTATKKHFQERLVGRVALAFTADNAYAIAVWAINNANKYFDEQTVTLYRDLSTFEGAERYKSNVKTWGKDQWRYFRRDEDAARPTHYSLDYRIVVERYNAIGGGWRFQHGLYEGAHDLIADIVAVMFNLGFPSSSPGSMARGEWVSGKWQNWYRMGDRAEILFQVKGFLNGNLHFRFAPDAMCALNVEAGRLLGWLRAPADVVAELGYSEADAVRLFGSTRAILPASAGRLLLGEGSGGDEQD